VGAPACPSALAAKQTSAPNELTTESVPFTPIPQMISAFVTHDTKTEVEVSVILRKMHAK
jgi:hypothetical protein